jgi:hypothetical protein
MRTAANIAADSARISSQAASIGRRVRARA